MKKNIFISTLLTLLSILLIINSKEINESSTYILSLLFSNIIPSLLPFMIILQFLLHFKSIDLFAFILQKISIKVFNISGYGLTAIITSFFGGFPLSSILINNLVNSQKISIYEAQKICNYTYFPSFSFLYSTLYFFNPIHKKTILIIIISLYFISFVFLFCFRNNKATTTIKIEELKGTNDNFLYSNLTTDILKTLANISISIFSFYLIKTTITHFVPKNFVHLIGSILEFSSTSLEILSNNNLDVLSIISLTFSISFGGICMLFQALPNIKKAKINIKKMIFARFFISFTTILLVLILINSF